MSLKINTNIQALNALRSLTGTVNQLGGSISRLSTGLRIVNASDDPAGLMISEGMRTQIRGLDQAIRNSQDAVNMAKTAEAALEEVQTLLRNMRSIAVHAANTAVVDSAQLQADQGQIRSSLQSIDRIARSTSWGTKNLLDGTTGTVANVTNPTAIGGIYLGGSFNGKQVVNGNVSINQVSPASSATLPTNRTFANSASVVSTVGSIVINGYSIVSDGTMTVQSLAARINEISTQTGVVASVTGAGPVSIRLTNTTPGSQFPLNFNDPAGVLHSVASVSFQGFDAAYDVTVPTVDGPETVQFTGGRGPGDSGLKITDTFGNLINITSAADANWGTLFGGATNVAVLQASSVQFQIGPNANQSVFLAMPRAFSANLGSTVLPGSNLSTIDVTSRDGANDALRIIDEAIRDIARARGDLGSFQANYLDSTVRSLGVAKENMTASESQIRDADMASEMTRFTQLQILQQSGVSMLAQANQQPRAILDLLRGQ